MSRLERNRKLKITRRKQPLRPSTLCSCLRTSSWPLSRVLISIISSLSRLHQPPSTACACVNVHKWRVLMFLLFSFNVTTLYCHPVGTLATQCTDWGHECRTSTINHCWFGYFCCILQHPHQAFYLWGGSVQEWQLLCLFSFLARSQSPIICPRRLGWLV